MIVDANVLLYAVDRTTHEHVTARSFLEDHLNGEVRVGLPWPSLTAFLRIATHPRVMAEPLSPADATAIVAQWLDAPAAWLPQATGATWSTLRRLVDTHHISGNLVPDAHLAALAIQHGVPVVSADSDFARFPEVDWINPFSGR